MVGLAAWHWLFVLSFIAIPLFAVAIFTSKERVQGREFLFWSLGWPSVLLAVTVYFVWSAPTSSGILPAIAIYSFWFFYVRRITGRTLDAGYSKWLAFLSFIPLANVIYVLVLLFAPTRETSTAREPSEVDVTPWRNG